MCSPKLLETLIHHYLAVNPVILGGDLGYLWFFGKKVLSFAGRIFDIVKVIISVWHSYTLVEFQAIYQYLPLFSYRYSLNK